MQMYLFIINDLLNTNWNWKVQRYLLGFTLSVTTLLIWQVHIIVSFLALYVLPKPFHSPSFSLRTHILVMGFQILLSIYRNMNLHMRTAHTRFGFTPPGNRVRIWIGYEFSLNLPVLVVDDDDDAVGGGGDDDGDGVGVYSVLQFCCLSRQVCCEWWSFRCKTLIQNIPIDLLCRLSIKIWV